MGYQHVKQAVPRLLCQTANGSEDTTLIGAGDNLTHAYRKANLADNTLKLQEFTNGAWITLASQVDGDTGTFELWGYPADSLEQPFSMPQFIGQFSYVTDEAKIVVKEIDYFYVDAFTEEAGVLDSPHTVAVLNTPDGIATIKFDTLGLRYIVGLITIITSSDDDGIAKLFLRPW